MTSFFAIFLNVIMPVFGIVMIGYLLGGRLALQAQTLTRAAYYVFVPAFIFQAISGSRIPLDDAAKMLCFIILVHLLAALLAGSFARIMGQTREMIAAFIMVSIAGNVGNYGLAMIHFRFGDDAVAPATLYYVALSITIFVVCVGAAGWAKGGGRGVLSGLLKTPAIWAAVPALLVSNSSFVVPLMLSRMIGLLAGAMIPVMLFSLGLQLLEQKQIRITREVLSASALRLIATPLLACLIAIPFSLNHLEYAAGVLQSAMPTAIMASIIAKEHGIAPHFVTTAVLVTTLASLVTLPIFMVAL
ncbi:MAG: transporter [Desulfuromonas sp.]|nr:MAG: transporter [Desulfuromonas sp.]